MEEEKKYNFGKYTIYQLYDLYFRIGRDEYPEAFEEAKREIRKRFNLPETEEITDESVKRLYARFAQGGNYKYSKYAAVRGKSSHFDWLASRMDRFLAALLDGIFITVPLIIIFIAFGVITPGNVQRQENILHTILYFIAGQAFYLLLNGYFLIEQSQTLGKKIIGTKIIMADGKKPSFFNIYVLRYMIPGLLMFIPLFGAILSLIDHLFIFGKDHRCLHDYLADTIVINSRAIIMDNQN